MELPKAKDTAKESVKTNPMDEISRGLHQMGGQIRHALPPHISPEKFIRVVLTAVQNNPDLLYTDKKQLFISCLKAAQDGLLPDGREAALVAYRGKEGSPGTVQYIPMVAGLLKKIRNSGEIASITSEIVFERDQFQYWVDEAGAHLNHRPIMFGDRGRPLGVYALAKTKEAEVYVEVLSSDDVKAIRSASKAKAGPWSGPFESEMWRKSAIRRLSKRLPMSTDIEEDGPRNEPSALVGSSRASLPNPLSGELLEYQDANSFGEGVADASQDGEGMSS